MQKQSRSPIELIEKLPNAHSEPVMGLFTAGGRYAFHGVSSHAYWSSSCKTCALKAQCTPSSERRVRRWEHGAVLDEMQRRLTVVV